MALLAVTTIYPVIYILFTALKDDAAYARDPLGPPPALDWSNLASILQKGTITAAFLHTAVVTAIALVLLLVSALLAGFIVAWGRFRFQWAIGAVLVVLLIQPAGLLMIPMVLVTYQLGLRDNLLGLALVYAGLLLPFNTYFAISYFRALPREVFEAAEIDGATHLQMFRSVALPLARPAVATLATLSFLFMWTDLLFALILLVSPQTQTLAPAVESLKGQFSVSLPVVAAGLLITIAPPLLVFLAAQRWFLAGIGAGSSR